MSKSIFQKFIDWVKSFFIEEYELTVWYVYEEYENEKGMKVKKRSEKTYHLKEIIKKTPKHILGKTVDNEKFEIKTVEPFDYQIRKIK